MKDHILNIFEFNGSITTAPTASMTSVFKAENNSRNGLNTALKHENKNITAVVATYCDDPDYVLDYVLFTLKLHRENITSTTNKQDSSGSYLITQYNLANNNPLIIVVNNSSSIPDNNKIAVEQVIKEFPNCSKYHYYDSNKTNLNALNDINGFHLHEVTKTDDFKIINTTQVEISTPTPILTPTSTITPSNKQQPIHNELVAQLEIYRNNRQNNPHIYSGWGSFFSFHFFGYSKMQKLEAVSALISAIQTGAELDSKHLNALNEGTLGKTVKTYLKKYSLELAQCVAIKKDTDNVVELTTA